MPPASKTRHVRKFWLRVSLGKALGLPFWGGWGSQIGYFWFFLFCFGSKPVSDGPLGAKGPSETGFEPKKPKNNQK